jgi:hypothetical protein
LARTAAAEETSPDSLAQTVVEWSATYASRYSFQGLDYSDGRPVLQPQISGPIPGITWSVWGNLDQTRGELNEVDIGLQREWSLGRSSGSFGYAYLRYPNRDWEPTHEAFADFALTAPIEPALSIHWDVAAGTGTYWTFGLSRELRWQDGTLSLESKLYVQDHYYGLSGIPAVETAVSFSAPWAGVAIRPTLARLWTWPNGSFHDEQAVHAGWVASVVFSSP